MEILCPSGTKGKRGVRHDRLRHPPAVCRASLVLLAMSLIVFVGIYAIGDPARDPDRRRMRPRPRSRRQAIQALGLDRPLPLAIPAPSSGMRCTAISAGPSSIINRRSA